MGEREGGREKRKKIQHFRSLQFRTLKGNDAPLKRFLFVPRRSWKVQDKPGTVHCGLFCSEFKH
jgi:hypothetical protein